MTSAPVQGAQAAGDARPHILIWKDPIWRAQASGGTGLALGSGRILGFLAQPDQKSQPCYPVSSRDRTLGPHGDVLHLP